MRQSERARRKAMAWQTVYAANFPCVAPVCALCSLNKKPVWWLRRLGEGSSSWPEHDST